MPTERLGEEMPGSEALHTDHHTLVRITTDPNHASPTSTRPDHQQPPPITR
jgi:hypothetical protein